MLIFGGLGVGGGLTTFSWTFTHTVCYAAVRSLELPHINRYATLLYVLLGFQQIRHATLLYVLLDFYTYVMLRCCAFSWTSTGIGTSCYAMLRC